MNNIRRINIFCGPGGGKTNIAQRVASELNSRFLRSDNHTKRAELIQEFCKIFAYEGRVPTGFDQLTIFAEQLRREELFLRNGVDLVVTDSPLLLQLAYAPIDLRSNIAGLIHQFEKTYPSINFFIERGDRPYNPKGRYQSLSEAQNKDLEIKQLLVDYRYDFVTVAGDEQTVCNGICEIYNG